MRIVADSDVLVYALHVPTNPAARRRHAKAVTLFDAFINGSNTLFVPSTVVIEVAAALSRIIGQQLAEVNVNDLISIATEIYPLSPSFLQTWLLSLSSQWYVAWKKGLAAYWLGGLSDQQVNELARGESISYP